MKAPQVTEPLNRELLLELRSKIKACELWNKDQKNGNYKDVLKFCRDKTKYIIPKDPK